MDKLLCLFIILILIAITSLAINVASSTYSSEYMLEKFTNYSQLEPGDYPSSEDGPLINKQYSYTGRKTVNNNGYNNIWWNYPTFKVGSYAQITNNLKYRKNPDDGTCIRADMCNVLYKNNQLKSNISKPLGPSPILNGSNIRVGYYTTNKNLFLGQQLGPELPTF